MHAHFPEFTPLQLLILQSKHERAGKRVGPTDRRFLSNASLLLSQQSATTLTSKRSLLFYTQALIIFYNLPPKGTETSD